MGFVFKLLVIASGGLHLILRKIPVELRWRYKNSSYYFDEIFYYLRRPTSPAWWLLTNFKPLPNILEKILKLYCVTIQHCANARLFMQVPNGIDGEIFTSPARPSSKYSHHELHPIDIGTYTKFIRKHFLM